MNDTQQLVILDTIFSGFASGIPIVHDNEKYDGDSEEWIRLSSQVASAKQKSLGDNPIYRYRGICYVQIFTKPDTGSGRAMEIVDMVTALLRSKTLNGITFYTPRSHKVGVVNGWYQVNVSTDFYRED